MRQSGTVVQNLEIHGHLRFADAIKNVVVRCVKVHTNEGYFVVDTERINFSSPRDIVMERIEVSCDNSRSAHAGMLLFGVTVRKAEVYGCIDAFRFDSEVILEDSLCRGLSSPLRDPHFDCVQTSGAQNAVIRHNTFRGRDTSDVAIWPDLGDVNNVLVTNNRFLGTPGYMIYVGKDGPPYQTTNVTVRGNQFGRGFGYGPCTVTASRPVWQGNVWIDTGKPVPLTAC